MSKVAHRVLELLFGIPLLLFGGYLIYCDISVYLWIAEDREHRHTLFYAWPIAILPFLIGCRLVSASVVLMFQR